MQVERRFDTSGAERYQEAQLRAVRLDGSYAEINRRQGPDGKFYEVGSIYDVPTGTIISVDGLTESIIKEKMGTGDLAFRKSINHKCASGTEHQTLAGLDTVKMVSTLDAGDRSTEETAWAAPDLDCFALSSTHVLSKPKGKPVAHNTTETQFVILGEPQPSLFVAPANYKERSPAEVADEYARRFGRPPFSDRLLQRSMEKYQRMHQ